MTRAKAPLIAWAMFCVVTALALAALVLSLTGRGGLGDQGLLLASVGMLGYAVVGALIASRFPANAVGWLLLVTAFGFVLSGAADAYAVRALLVGRGSLPRGDVAAWINNWAVVVPLAAIPLIVLLFPDGRLPSPRWRPVAWGMVTFPLIGTAGLMLRPGSAGGTATAPNLTGVESLRAFAAWLMTVGAVGSLLTALVCVCGLILRLRRARGEARQQVRWLAYVGATAALLLVGGFVTDEGFLSDLLFNVFVFVLAFGVPVAVGVAIFRYRLYDIDLVINKTLVYGALGAFITAVYVGVVVGIGNAIGTRGQPNLPLQVAATAVVAVAFQPVRARVQHLANRLVYGKRATPYEVMAAFGARMAGSIEVEQVLPRTAEAAARGIGGARARVRVLLPEGNRREAHWPEGTGGDAYDVVLSVTHRGEEVGEIAVAKPAGDPLRPAEESLLRDLASQAGLALHNVRLTTELREQLEEISRQAAELRESRARIVTAADEERRRLERTMEDRVERRLEQLAGTLREALSRGPSDGQALAAHLEGLRVAAQDTLEELREIARGIYPPLLADQGLAAAVQAHARKSRLPVTVEPDGVGRYPAEAEAAVYFCLVEALQNAAKHSKASQVEVRLEGGEGELRFSVTDDGRGFDPGITQAGAGLQNMRDRLEALGGRFQVRSSPGQGTVLVGRVPAAVEDLAR